MNREQGLKLAEREARRRGYESIEDFSPLRGGQGRTGEDVKNDAEAILLVFLLVFASIAWALCCGGGSQP